MRAIEAVRPIVLAAMLVTPPLFVRAQSGPDAVALEHATAEYGKDNLHGALALDEDVLTHSPDNVTALYQSALINLRLNNADAARGRLERLVKLSGSYFAAWELMVQVTQAQGDLARRDEAIDRLKISIRTAIDPDIRRRSDFIRERFTVGDQEMMVVDNFGRGGSDFTRYQFSLGDPRMRPDTGLILRTDATTTENWANTALLAPEKQLFHLDMVDLSDKGDEKVAIYEYYAGEPSYDVVHAKVMQILRGEAKPLSGEPGSLQGILNR